MIDPSNARAITATAVLAICKQLTELIGNALLSSKHAHGTELWRLHSVLATEAHPVGGVEPAGVVRLSFQGTIQGSIYLHIEQNGADHLFASVSGKGTDQDVQENWLQFVQSAEPALRQALVDLGTPVLSSERPTAAPDLIAIGELQLRTESGSAAATVVLLCDPTMHAALERFESTTRPGGSAIVRGQHDEKHLHRVINVPLAVTLRFGQRQMTLRELLALTTGSLVELDRQVEEPVELMLGERVLARGEVVIVDGNYGLRITEIVEKQVARELTAVA